MPETSPIKIAVIGGGLAGAAIANGLLRHAHLDVHVYESAPEFSERGAAVGLASDAQRALKQVVGDSEAITLLEKAGAVVQASSRLCIVRHNPITHITWVCRDQVLTIIHRDPARMREPS